MTVRYEVELHTGYDVLSKKHAELNTALRQFDRLAPLTNPDGPINAIRLWRMGGSSANRCLCATDQIAWNLAREAITEEP